MLSEKRRVKIMQNIYSSKLEKMCVCMCVFENRQKFSEKNSVRNLIVVISRKG